MEHHCIIHYPGRHLSAYGPSYIIDIFLIAYIGLIPRVTMISLAFSGNALMVVFIAL